MFPFKANVAYPHYESFLFGPFREVVGIDLSLLESFEVMCPLCRSGSNLVSDFIGNACEARCPRCLYSNSTYVIDT